MIANKIISYNGVILARAASDSGEGVCRIVVEGSGTEQVDQRHKACGVFVRENECKEIQDFRKKIEDCRPAGMVHCFYPRADRGICYISERGRI